MGQIHYTPTVGRKFYEDGTVRHFPGNTIICFTDAEGQAYQDAVWVQEQLALQSYCHKFTLLPPESLHMTVFQLLTDQTREPDRWSSHLTLDMPLVETDAFFIGATDRVLTPENFQMVYSHLNLGANGLSLYIKPKDDENAARIKTYRDRIATVTGVRFPDHDTYHFHISLAYKIINLDETETEQHKAFAGMVNECLEQTFGIFDTGKPQLTFFDDMFAFATIDERPLLKSRATNA